MSEVPLHRSQKSWAQCESPRPEPGLEFRGKIAKSLKFPLLVRCVFQTPTSSLQKVGGGVIWLASQHAPLTLRSRSPLVPTLQGAEPERERARERERGRDREREREREPAAS